MTVALFMSPWIIGFVAFTVYPMLSSLYFSFTSYDLLSTPRWIGTANYTFMFTKDPLFWTAVKNTAFIIILGLPLRLVVAIATATLLVRPRRAIKSYRTAVFIPTLAPAVAGALAFLYLFNPSSGPVNQLLTGIGFSDPPLWLYDAQWSKPTLVLLAIWGVGDAMIIFLAGMLNVPAELYEAADIEGASGRQRFWHVTLPDDLAGDLLLARDRDHRGLPVLHPGLRGEPVANGRPRPDRLSPELAALLHLAPVPDGVPELQDGLRLGAGVGAVPDHDDLHARS